MNVKGRWLKKFSTWRKISLNTWSTPDNATIYGLLDVDIGPLQDYLKKRTEESGVKCTITHAVARGLGILLKKYPDCNVLVRGRKIWLREEVDIFHQVAMPIDTKKGAADLSGAVIRRVDTKQIPQIAKELRERAEAVRAKKDGEMAKTRSMLKSLPNLFLRVALKIIGWLQYAFNLKVPTTPRDPFGGAMVTSVGMFDIKLAYAPLVTFTRVPIILLVGTAEDRPVVRDGEIVIRKMCSITATLDHRVLDGYLAGLLSREMKKLMENPELLDEDPSAPE